MRNAKEKKTIFSLVYIHFENSNSVVHLFVHVNTVKYNFANKFTEPLDDESKTKIWIIVPVVAAVVMVLIIIALLIFKLKLKPK